jgi:hypothetical protein
MPSPSPEPVAVVQRQLDAYNAHDLEALLATYAEDAQHFDHPDQLLASGAAQLRERFMARFQDAKLHAKLLHRSVVGNVVADHEEVTCTFPEGPGRLKLLAIYEVRQDRIARAWFIRGARTLDVGP